MDRLIKKICIIVITIIVQHETIAQDSNKLKAIDETINESVFVSTNTNVFLTGETLYYKLFCLDKTTFKTSKYSKIAYVEIIESNKKTIIKQQLFLENATASGDIFLPTTLETGNYKIIGYTSWVLNKDNLTCFVGDIKIINQYNNLDLKNISVTKDSLKNNKFEVKKSGSLKISTNKKNYTSRELVTLEIKNTTEKTLLEKGNYNISVKKANNLFTNNSLNAVTLTSSNKNIENVFNNNKIIPEVRGEIISGRITSRAGVKIAEKHISLSIPGENYIFKISKTNSNGFFNFILDKKNTNSNVIVQVADENKADFAIEIFENKSPKYDAITFEKFEINTNTKDFIEKKSIANQIENAFYENKKDSVLVNIKLDDFYKKQAVEYILDTYTRFPTLKETIIEVVEGLYAESKNKTYNLYLRDFDLNNKLDIPAMVIVDGLLILDINNLLDHKAALFEKIEIIKGGYYYGSKLFNGLISFTTKNKEYENNPKGNFVFKPSILRPENNKTYYQPDYSRSKLSRIPDYREQLLWNPNVTLSEKEKPISFYTSDLEGEFEIVLEGFTNEGVPVYETETITIK